MAEASLEDSVIETQLCGSDDDVISRCFSSILSILSSVPRSMAQNSKNIALYPHAEKIRHEVERLYLWGQGHSVRTGNLDKNLSNLIDLRLTVLSRLYELGVVLQRCILPYVSFNATLYSSPTTSNLECILKTALTILRNHNQEVIDYGPLPQSDCDAIDLSSSIEDLQVLIDCLMDLSLAIDSFPEGPYVSAPTVAPSSQVEASSQITSIFFEKVYELFPLAPHWLVKRLSEACSAVAEKASHLRPKKNHSRISLITEPFVTERIKLRIPALPRAAQDGNRYTCMVCSQTLRNITSCTEWKDHVSDDLHPFVCTFPDCALSDEPKQSSFSSLAEWVNHERDHHGTGEEGRRCPLCVNSSYPTLYKVGTYFMHLLGHLRCLWKASVFMVEDYDGVDDLDDLNGEDQPSSASLQLASSQTRSFWGSNSVNSNTTEYTNLGSTFSNSFSHSTETQYPAEQTDHTFDIYNVLPSPPAGALELPCGFVGIGSCDVTFSYDETEAWIEHILTQHLRDTLPSKALCWYCDDFQFNAREEHIKEHIGDGKTASDIRHDFHIIEHLHRRNLISEARYTQCKRYAEILYQISSPGYIPSERQREQEHANKTTIEYEKEERRRRPKNRKK